MNKLSIIASITSKFEIGKENDLLYKLKGDIQYFKNVTIGHTVIMGRKTWKSIPEKFRPLKGRDNIVLTKNKNVKLDGVRTMSFNQFKKWYSHQLGKNPEKEYYVIGGSQIYSLFLNDDLLKPSNLYLTHIVAPVIKKDKKVTFEEPHLMHYFPDLPECYKLICYSEKMTETIDDTKVQYQFLKYKYHDDLYSCERQYLDCLSDILHNGKNRGDRTGTGTISVFGRQMRFKLTDGTIPILTTKQVPWKSCIHELLWFLRGDTDAKILQNQGVKIWDGNTSREFLDSRGLSHYDEGILGPGYGFQWRHFGAEYNQKYADTSTILDKTVIGGFDQIGYLVDELKNNPFSRRIFLSAWNPIKSDEMALVPCHVSCQFYVEESTEKGSCKPKLSCHMYQRSADMFLGEPWNILSYSILTYILAKKCNMEPNEVIISLGDAHIYNDHIENVKIQLERSCRPFPKIIVSDSVKDKDFSELSINDFSIVGYFPHSRLSGKMSV